MKAVLCFLIVVAVGGATAKLTCQDKPADVPKVWITMKKTCIDSMRAQVQAELHASMQYLAMAAHFSRDVINRPGFAKTFFESASEEREHSIKLIEYLSMRGDLTSNVSSLITMPKVEKSEWVTGVEALKDALKLEAKVTNLIRGVISDCENSDEFNDYHLVDYLTDEYLTEQYHGQRVLAGQASTLDKMMRAHGALGEFLFDKKLLNGAPL
nr:ferritin 2 [Limnephilus flavicornis]